MGTDEIRREFAKLRKRVETADKGYPLSRVELYGIVRKLFATIDQMLDLVDQMAVAAAGHGVRQSAAADSSDEDDLAI